MYGGVSYGQTDYDSEGYSDGSGFGLRLGYQINDNFAVEEATLMVGRAMIMTGALRGISMETRSN